MSPNQLRLSPKSVALFPKLGAFGSQKSCDSPQIGCLKLSKFLKIKELAALKSLKGN